MPSHLAPRQLETLDALLDFRGEHGYFPSVRELGDLLGISASTAHHHLRALEDVGAVQRTPGQPRALRVLDGWRP